MAKAEKFGGSQTGRQGRAERVVSAALKQFLAHGFDGVTLDDIAISAAVETDVLIHEFGDKHSLAMAMLRQIEYQFMEPLVARIADSPVTPQGKLVGLINGLSTVAAKRSDYVVLLVRFGIDFKGRGDELEERANAINAQLVNIADGIIKMGALRGSFRTDIKRADLATLVIGSLNGLLLEWWRRGEEVNGVKLTRALRRVILRGFEDATSKEEFGVSKLFPGHHP